MKTFIKYLIEKIEMKAPAKPRYNKNKYNEISSNWTTAKGNRVNLSFEPAYDRIYDDIYDVVFSVNGNIGEDVTRSQDKEILQTVLHQIKHIIDENDIQAFMFSAYNDTMDNKLIGKLIKPFIARHKELMQKYMHEPIGNGLYHIGMCYPSLNHLEWRDKLLKAINEILSYKDLPNDVRAYVTDLKPVAEQIYQSELNPDAPNRRLAIYKRLLSQYLGSEWVVTEKKKDTILVRKSS